MRLSRDKLLKLLDKNPLLRINPDDLDHIRDMPKTNKYRNVITEVDGIKFHSKAEANRYCELKLLKKSGEIMDFKRQVSFRLGAGITYIVDFLITHNDGREEAEEVKGFWTETAKIKVRLFREKYPGIILTVIGHDLERG